MIPVNTAITTWDEPARRLDGGTRTVRPPRRHRDRQPAVAAPREASEGFSDDLTAQLLHLRDPGHPEGPWAAAHHAFDQALSALP